LSAAV